MSEEYYCVTETQTGIAVAHDLNRKLFWVVPACHPQAPVTEYGHGSIGCDHCRTMYSAVKEKEDWYGWSPSWSWENLEDLEYVGHVLEGWISGWTRIPRSDIDANLEA